MLTFSENHPMNCASFISKASLRKAMAKQACGFAVCLLMVLANSQTKINLQVARFVSSEQNIYSDRRNDYISFVLRIYSEIDFGQLLTTKRPKLLILSQIELSLSFARTYSFCKEPDVTVTFVCRKARRFFPNRILLME